MDSDVCPLDLPSSSSLGEPPFDLRPLKIALKYTGAFFDELCLAAVPESVDRRLYVFGNLKELTEARKAGDLPADMCDRTLVDPQGR
jgi:hypothetical protein